jgi:diketogulonate reductase-like aldo/keto reductase
MTSKIPTHRVKSKLTAAYALKAVQEDMKELETPYLDLVLIHHPASTDAENQALWKGLEQAVAMNLTRSIGLSNFNQAQIEALLKIATINPAVNQW